jgi:hypothetical protein
VGTFREIEVGEFAVEGEGDGVTRPRGFVLVGEEAERLLGVVFLDAVPPFPLSPEPADADVLRRAALVPLLVAGILALGAIAEIAWTLSFPTNLRGFGAGISGTASGVRHKEVSWQKQSCF